MCGDQYIHIFGAETGKPSFFVMEKAGASGGPCRIVEMPRKRSCLPKLQSGADDRSGPGVVYRQMHVAVPACDA